MLMQRNSLSKSDASKLEEICVYSHKVQLQEVHLKQSEEKAKSFIFSIIINFNTRKLTSISLESFSDSRCPASSLQAEVLSKHFEEEQANHFVFCWNFWLMKFISIINNCFTLVGLGVDLLLTLTWSTSPGLDTITLVPELVRSFFQSVPLQFN